MNQDIWIKQSIPLFSQEARVYFLFPWLNDHYLIDMMSFFFFLKVCHILVVGTLVPEEDIKSVRTSSQETNGEIEWLRFEIYVCETQNARYLE